jgi:hypothetical protein
MHQNALPTMFVPEHSEHTDIQLPDLRKRLMSEEGSSWSHCVCSQTQTLRAETGAYTWSLVIMTADMIITRPVIRIRKGSHQSAIRWAHSAFRMGLSIYNLQATSHKPIFLRLIYGRRCSLERPRREREPPRLCALLSLRPSDI